MRIPIDMNLSPQWCAVLQRRGHTCVHWSEIGSPRASDKTIMAWALQNQYVVFTHDLGFGAILATTQAHGPSVIQIRTQDVLPDFMQSLLLGVLTEHESLLESGALIVVDEHRCRARILPLRGR